MTQQEFTARYSYNIETDELGSGGFGSVYKAYDNKENCFVALKISAVDSKHPDIRLRNEVAKARDLRHDNVARYEECYTFKQLSGETDIAIMRYYELGSLDGILRRGDLSLEQRCDILTQILEGVAFLHTNGIIHRDLKPQNVLMEYCDGRYIPKITDFGISKQLEDGESSLVSNSVLGGTRSYASPEQLCERSIRKNTDLWSFGVIAYFMLTGELPFNTGTLSPSSDEGRSEQLRQILSGRLSDAINDIPEPWQSVIRGCLVVDGKIRLQHAEDCLAILRNGAEYFKSFAAAQLSKKVDVCDDYDESTRISNNKVNVDVIVDKNNESRSNRKWWIIILVLIVGIIVFTILGLDNGDNNKNVNEDDVPVKRVATESINQEDSFADEEELLETAGLEVQSQKRVDISFYAVDKNDFFYYYSGLCARVDGIEYRVSLRDDICLEVVKQEDFDGDGVDDVLVEDIQACGGNACGNALFFVRYAGDGYFSVSDVFGENVGEDIIIEMWNGEKSVLIVDSVLNDNYEWETHKRRYVYRHGQAVLVEDLNKGPMVAVKEIKYSDFPGDKIDKMMTMTYDLDENGITDKISCSSDYRGLGFSFDIMLNKSSYITGSYIVNRVGVLSTKTNGMHDLVIDNDTVGRWNGEEYVFERDW